jgi:hypothetical protein
VLAMLHPGQDLALRGTIAFPLVGDNHPWNVLTALEELAEELLGGLFVAPPLDQDIEDIAIVIYGPPVIVALRVDRDEHLIQMPCVAWAGTLATRVIASKFSSNSNKVLHWSATRGPLGRSPLSRRSTSLQGIKMRSPCTGDGVDWHTAARIYGTTFGWLRTTR